MKINKVIFGVILITVGAAILILAPQCPPLSRHQEEGHWQFIIVDSDKRLVACKDCNVVLLHNDAEHQVGWSQLERLRDSQ